MRQKDVLATRYIRHILSHADCDAGCRIPLFFKGAGFGFPSPKIHLDDRY